MSLKLEKRSDGGVRTMLSRTIDTWIDIEASPDRIWEVLIDFSKWSIWNSFIPLVEGELQKGETLQIQVNPPGLKTMTFRPKISSIIQNKEIIQQYHYNGTKRCAGSQFDPEIIEIFLSHQFLSGLTDVEGKYDKT